MAIETLTVPPPGWHIVDVMRKGDPDRPFRRGRPRNVWVALLIDVDPDLHSAGIGLSEVSQKWLDLGRHKSRSDAWDCAEALVATKH